MGENPLRTRFQLAEAQNWVRELFRAPMPQQERGSLLAKTLHRKENFLLVADALQQHARALDAENQHTRLASLLDAVARTRRRGLVLIPQPYLKHSNFAVRSAALQAFGATAGKKGARVIFESMGPDAKGIAVALHLYALAENARESALPYLEPFLDLPGKNDEEAELVAHAVTALGATRHEKALSLLEKAVKRHKNNAMAMENAALALGQIRPRAGRKGEAARKTIAKLLGRLSRHRAGDVSQTAKAVLGRVSKGAAGRARK